METHSPVGAIARLRAETGMLQRRVERDLSAFGRSASWLDYRLYLCRMYGFLAPVECALDATPGLAAVVRDADDRNTKAALLVHDLVSLGVDRSHFVQIPRISVPLIDEVPEALGWMYVIESSTLEANRLTRHLTPGLSSEVDPATAYLRCYGDAVNARWLDFCAALESYVHGAEAGVCDRIVLAATDCLIRLHRWLPPPSSAHVRADRVA